MGTPNLAFFVTWLAASGPALVGCQRSESASLPAIPTAPAAIAQAASALPTNLPAATSALLPVPAVPLLNFRQFAGSSDWSLLAAVGVQNELRLYGLPEGELLLAQPLGVARTLGVSMSADTTYLAFYVFKSGNQGAAIQVWGRAGQSR